MKKYKYKFSVIIPIYNVEEYLSETIDSVINQTIGFKENIQIILVNDGSPDNSEEICLQYQEMYPENIVYVKQKNAGVSAARNNGMKYVEGEFVNFLDSDDKWSKDAFEIVYKNYENNKKIKIFSTKMIFFDAKRGGHPLNYKYEEDKIIDILEDWKFPQLSGCSIFIHESLLKDVKFDSSVKYSEDNKFINTIILNVGKYMVLEKPTYFYRRRKNDDSAINKQKENVDYYTVTPKKVYKYLLDLSKKIYGEEIKYIQYVVMYDLQWRIKHKVPNSIDKKIIKEYKETIMELIKRIDDRVILRQKYLFSEHKIEVLNRKHGRNIENELTTKFGEEKSKLHFEKSYVMNLVKEDRLGINRIIYKKDKIRIIGILNIPLNKEYFEFFCVTDKETYKIDLEKTIVNKKVFIDEEFISNYGFDIEIPNNFKKLCFKIKSIKKDNIFKLHINLYMNTGLSNNQKNFKIANNKIYYYNNEYIKVLDNNKKNRIKMHLRYLKDLITSFKFNVIFIRCIYYILRKTKKEEIWLISDRFPVANDNGYAFFKYINSIKLDNIEPYFVINKDSQDLDKVKKTGKYVYYNSLKYKLYFLLSKNIISSHADSFITNAFGGDGKFYRDLFHFNYTFLQHGITKDDISDWLNKYSKKIDIFVTCANDEYNSIIKNNNYGFKEDIVKLTGFPRYDLLNNDNTKNTILIMPTWRKSLAAGFDLKSAKRRKNEKFIESDYFNFYNNLINDEKLIKVMQENNYKGLFVIHPALISNVEDFTENDTIEVAKEMVEYSDLFNKSKLLISDFSSVPFDFAYLNKPVIYTQFDKESFFEQHLYDEGYFSYEDDGFGPVLYNYEDTVNTIIKYIENDCKLEKKYQDRINKFYKFHDKDNSKRVLEEILKLK